MTEKIIYVPIIPEIRRVIKSASEYEIFALMYALDERGNKIYFSNGYLARMLGKTERAIVKSIAKLEKKGFIKRIIKGTNRVILIVKEKIELILGRTEVHTPRPKVHNTTLSKSSTNNIVINNKKDECKFSHDFIKNYFISLIGKNEKNMDIELMTKKFINKHLSEGSPSKNKKIWKGLARNWLLSWESNTQTDNNETSKQTPYTTLLKLAKQAKSITINNQILKVVNAKFTSAINGKEYSVYNSLLNWYDRGEGDIKIDGNEIKV